MTALALRAVTKAFGRQPVLRGVDLDVPDGGVTAVLGRSGSGKTTLLRIIAGFSAPDTGTVQIGGRTACDGSVFLPPERRQIGYVSQDNTLFQHLSVAANIGFGLPRRLRRGAVVEEMLDLVGLSSDHAGRFPHELSGGEQQRVALARTLAPKPALVLLDEPFASLDVALRADTRRSTMRVIASSGATAVLVTHDQSEALSLADQVAVLRDGVMAQVADPTILYQFPADSDLAAFVGEAVLIPGYVDGRTATCRLGRLPVSATPAAAPGPALIMIRPEQLRLCQTDHRQAAGPFRVIDTIYYGPNAVVQLALDDHTEPVVISVRINGYNPSGPNESLWLTVEGQVLAYPPQATTERPASGGTPLDQTRSKLYR
jgi:iron(III) transport system ATP-binding protein